MVDAAGWKSGMAEQSNDIPSWTGIADRHYKPGRAEQTRPQSQRISCANYSPQIRLTASFNIELITQLAAAWLIRTL